MLQAGSRNVERCFVWLSIVQTAQGFVLPRPVFLSHKAVIPLMQLNSWFFFFLPGATVWDFIIKITSAFPSP